MRKYRAKLKEKRNQFTAKQKAEERRKWRNAKRKQRAGVSHQAKQEREINDLKRRLKKLSPQDFADMVETSTPKKKHELARRGIEVGLNIHQRERLHAAKTLYDTFRNQVKKLKVKRDQTSRLKLKILTAHLHMSTKASTTRLRLGLKWKSLQKYSMISEESEMSELAQRKKRCDAFTDKERNDVANFFEENATPLPLKKQAQNKVLTDSTKVLHSDYLKKNPKARMSLSSFQRLRPSGILTVDRSKFVSCLCEYCLNLDYKVSFTMQGTHRSD